MNTTYGQILEELLQISSQKNYNLADELGYDVSYISKWIKGKRVPSSKSIRGINKSIARFILNSLGDIEKDEIINKFNLDEGISREELEYSLEKKLYDAYELSLNKKNESGSNSVQYNNAGGLKAENNGVVMLNVAERRKHFKEVLIEGTKNNKTLDVITMANIFSLSQRDKLYIAGIKKIGINNLYSINNRVRIINDFRDVSDRDLVYNSIFFINMMSKAIASKIEMYSFDFTPYNAITVVKDVLLYNSIFTNPENCLMSTTSTDKKVVNEIYENLNDIAESQAIETFEKRSPLDMIRYDLYLDFLGNERLKIMLNQLNEMFLPTELFLELGSYVFGTDKYTLEKLKRIDFFLKNIINKLGVDVILYDEVLDDYLSNGEILFFNNKIKLTLEQRKQHIEYIRDVFDNNESMNIKVIDEDFIKNLKHFDNPTLYLSKKISFLQSGIDDLENNYLVIKDNHLEKALNKFFKKIWRDDNLLMLDKKDVLKDIERKIIYSEFLMKEVERN